jgi:hypothetical protein
MVSVLAIGFNVHEFKHGRGGGFFRAIKARITPTFGGKVKLEIRCRKVLRHVKIITCKYEQKYFARPNSSLPSPVPHSCYQMTLLI